jgi:hypothetical protein
MAMNHYYDEVWGETVVNMDGLRKQIGKFVLADTMEDNSTRLFLQDPNCLTNARKKAGWWNIFTLATKPCDEGLYLCEIKDLRQDKDGHPIFIVEAGAKLDRKLMAVFSFSAVRGTKVLTLFARSGLFAEELNFDTHCYDRYNIGAVGKALGVTENIEAEAVRKLQKGEITWQEIARLLDELYPHEQEAFILFRDNESMSKDYPFLAKKAKKFAEEKGYTTSLYWDEQYFFLMDHVEGYERLHREGYIVESYESSYDKAEAKLRYWDEQHKAQKAAKKAARKAAKKAAAASA